tara:strand:- start:366 stop:767 length:402 start_codon:yes stop_codon:yes gene_type:complete
LSLLSKILGTASGALEPIQAVGNIAENIFGSKDRKLTHTEFMAELAQQPQVAQVELNKVEAGHRSIFIAGWRPAVGWVCAIGLCFPFLINPCLQWITGEPGPQLPVDNLNELVFGLLGLGAMRSFEKFTGKAK